MMRVVSLSFLLVISFFQDVQQQQNVQQSKSYEKLTIHKDHYHLEFSYDDNKSNIPKSLKNLLRQMSVKALLLQMGFINPSALHKYQSPSPQALNFPYINYGISLLIKNSTTFLNQNFQSFAQIFSISRDSTYMVYLPEVQTTFVSNPNDKFCAQNLKNILDVFMPCNNAAGIESVINEKTFFTQKAFAGIKLVWNIGGKINLSFYLDQTTQQVKNYLKLSKQKRYFKRCMHFDQFLIKNQSQKQQQDSAVDLRQSKLPQIVYTSSISTDFHSNYYNRLKNVYFRIDLFELTSDIREHDSMINKSQITIAKGRILFPKGFRIEKVSFDCLNSCMLHVQRVESQVTCQKSYKNHQITLKLQGFLNGNMLVMFQARIFPNLPNYNEKKSNFGLERSKILNQNPELSIKIDYKSQLKPFEQYQTIAGGGQEISNIPLTVEMDNNLTFIVLGYKNRNMFDRLLQPDFSIPFKTITFTIAIFGYLWIAIWKAYYSQVHIIQKKTTQ